LLGIAARQDSLNNSAKLAGVTILLLIKKAMSGRKIELRLYVRLNRGCIKYGIEVAHSYEKKK